MENNAYLVNGLLFAGGGLFLFFRALINKNSNKK